MKRLRRFGCLVSLVLCLVMVFAWGRSTEAVDLISYDRWENDGDRGVITMYSILSRGGSVGWYCPNRMYPVEWGRPSGWWSWKVSPLVSSDDGRDFPAVGRLGFALGQTPWGVPVALVPYWLPVLLTSIPPLWLLMMFRRRYARSLNGLCVDCGYDLRATEGRCPECGTMVVSK